MHNFPICHLDVIVANAARTNAQDPALVHARFTAPNLILALCPQLTFHHLLVCARGCAVFCVCVRASVGSLVYNFKVGLRQQEANGEHAARRRTHTKNVLAKSGQMYVSLLQLIMASNSTDLRALSPSLSLSLSLTHSVSPSLACFGLSFILLQPLWATLSHNVIIGPMMMACPQDKFFVIPHSSPHFPPCLSVSPLSNVLSVT